jgi:hypothetical protein
MDTSENANQIHDPDLWQRAATLRELHQADTSGTPTTCRLCTTAWPCPTRQAADRATRTALRHPADLFLHGEDHQIAALHQQLNNALNDLAVTLPTPVHTGHRGATCNTDGGRPVRPAPGKLPR